MAIDPSIGIIQSGRGPTADDVKINAEDGGFVINADAMEYYGEDNMINFIKQFKRLFGLKTTETQEPDGPTPIKVSKGELYADKEIVDTDRELFEAINKKQIRAEDFPKMIDSFDKVSRASYSGDALDKLLNYHFDRLGVKDKENAKKNWHRFVNTLIEAESANNGEAKNPNSSARGYTQFLDGSVKPAIERTNRILQRMGVESPFEDDFRGDRDLEILAVSGDLLAKRVAGKSGYGDELAFRIAKTGDQEAMRDLYLYGHHTLTGDEKENAGAIKLANRKFIT